MRSFETWTEEDVQDLLGFQKSKNLSILNDWLAPPFEPCSEADQKTIALLQKLLQDNGSGWNEDELKLNFIAPFLLAVYYYTDHYKPFSQRKLAATVNNIEIGGVIDYLLASGKQTPKHPFFCLHEYKRQRGRSTANDPLGQLLAEMITIQHLNQQKGIEHPIYGMYVEGKFWNFIVLEGNTYAESEPLNANTHEIYTVFAILKKLKTIIQDLIELS